MRAICAHQSLAREVAFPQLLPEGWCQGKRSVEISFVERIYHSVPPSHDRRVSCLPCDQCPLTEIPANVERGFEPFAVGIDDPDVNLAVAQQKKIIADFALPNQDFAVVKPPWFHPLGHMAEFDGSQPGKEVDLF